MKFAAALKYFVDEVGGTLLLLFRAFRSFLQGPREWREILKQMEQVGIYSLPVVTLTTAFTGMVFALNSYIGFKRFGAQQYTGSVVGIALTKELIPVLTGIMIAGRVGASIAAELGTMKVSEQIDALYTLNTDPVSYLVVPRVFATTVMVPLLTIYGDAVGLLGAYVVAVFMMGLNPVIYNQYLYFFMEPWDIFSGVIKAISFGTIVGIVSCYKGLKAEGGAEGVGRATTVSVVVASITILIADFIWGKILPWTLRE